jgi:ATP-binding cassette subfamily B protein/ATP-binding cassette subfamily C protein/ATP-binding cassette subfamily B multidrug efflux pump
VPQEAFLFSASIADNIALARPQSSRAEVEHAARLAALHDDVLRFPQG